MTSGQMTCARHIVSGRNRTCLSLNNWAVMSNAIASPFSSSPWHIELCDKQNEAADLQRAIDVLEQSNDTKTALLDAFRKAVLTGYGYIVVSTDVNEQGEPEVIVESARNINSVAMDPFIDTCDGSDGEQAAIVNYISVKKAKRLYGDDVVPYDYPRVQPAMSLSTMQQWNVPSQSVAVVSYYKKNEAGLVDFYKICGDKVVTHVELPCSVIPVIRLAGNEIYEDNRINYDGIVRQTFALELGANIAYSTLIERCGRSTKANFIANVDAIEGLEEYYRKADQDDSMLIMYKGNVAPQPITEQFQTGDLQNTIASCRTLMEDCIGVPLAGIAQNQPEKTATEILRQQISKESNTACYYNNAYTACRTLARIVIQLLNDNVDLPFTLENGPSVITRQMKARQELTALATICPDTVKPIIAKYYADTLQDDVGDDLSRNIVANLPQDVKFITSDATDPTAIHQLQQMRATLDATMQQLEQAQAENAQMKQELQNAQATLIENREARQLDWQKFIVQQQNQMQLESARLQSQNVKAAADIEQKNKELTLKANEAAAKVIQDSNNQLREAGYEV